MMQPFLKIIVVKNNIVEFNSNFNQKRIESLFSNLSSLSLLKLLKKKIVNFKLFSCRC